MTTTRNILRARAAVEGPRPCKVVSGFSRSDVAGRDGEGIHPQRLSAKRSRAESTTVCRLNPRTTFARAACDAARAESWRPVARAIPFEMLAVSSVIKEKCPKIAPCFAKTVIFQTYCVMIGQICCNFGQYGAEFRRRYAVFIKGYAVSHQRYVIFQQCCGGAKCASGSTQKFLYFLFDY